MKMDKVYRIRDIIASFLGLVVLSPIIIITAILVAMFMGSPIFYKQVRAGRDGIPFTMIKFRTMVDAVDEHGNDLPDEERLTKVGKIMRKFSIDELPELWNVLKGDMSVVGPRPLYIKYIPRYNDRQKKRLQIRPGLTGWSQVNGRNSLTWENRFEMDVWYVENRSFMLDVKILFKTIGVVFMAKGINQEGHATMQEFMGSKEK
jgi:lipopolysaccharide/colanic/teichoic acid biosynthesis glycosyltransferase